MKNLAIYCVDVGSINKNRFGWAANFPNNQHLSGNCIEELASQVANSIRLNHKVAIGFECPLFVPVRKAPMQVNSARTGEGNRSWSAGAGTGALATGLVEILWLMNRLNELLGHVPRITFRWSDFEISDVIFLWEAFVTSTAKGNSHTDDAMIAINKFQESLPNPETANAIQEENVLSLVGAAALRAGWTTDLKTLSTACLVIKA